MTRIILILKRWGPAILVMGLIFYASSIPSEKMPYLGTWDLLFKKGGHMTGYALVYMCILRGLGENQKYSFLMALTASLLYAISDEYHQTFVAGRNASIIDVGIDMLGASASLWFIWRFRQIRAWILT